MIYTLTAIPFVVIINETLGRECEHKLISKKAFYKFLSSRESRKADVTVCANFYLMKDLVYRTILLPGKIVSNPSNALRLGLHPILVAVTPRYELWRPIYYTDFFRKIEKWNTDLIEFYMKTSPAKPTTFIIYLKIPEINFCHKRIFKV